MTTLPSTCRCDEPDADPYECEADDCTGYFSELNPFGAVSARPRSTQVTRTCPNCDWSTVWGMDDGSADEELYRHIARQHGDTEAAL